MAHGARSGAALKCVRSVYRFMIDGGGRRQQVILLAGLSMIVAEAIGLLAA